MKQTVLASVLTAVIIASGSILWASNSSQAVAQEQVKVLQEAFRYQQELIKDIPVRMAVVEQIADKTTENLKTLTSVVRELSITVAIHNEIIKQDK